MLLNEHSKAQTMKIARYISNDPARFKTLMHLCLSDDAVLIQRASWAMRTVAEKHPEQLTPFLKKLISNLEISTHPAFKRNTLALLQFRKIPSTHKGILTDCCFSTLSNASEPIAVHVFAMTVLLSMCKEFPELKNELKIILEDQLPYASAGYRSRALRTLKELEKIN